MQRKPLRNWPDGLRVLVLDTIHGGAELAGELRAGGHQVDAVDVYRGGEGISVAAAMARRYDLVAAPVHLDPNHPLLQSSAAPCITHHEAVRQVLISSLPRPMIEITGARGKTTTAHALAHLMQGPGVLHTSTGSLEYPEKSMLWRKSITPASVIPAARRAHALGGWLIAEESIGVTGAGDVAVLTSGEDYRIAGGRKSALAEKCRLIAAATTAIVPRGTPISGSNVLHLEEAVECSGSVCRYCWNGVSGTFTNPLCELNGYRTPLMLAAAAACVLGIDPSPLGTFSALPGRMAARREGGVLVVDNANSGTNAETTIEAARYARTLSGSDAITLVIGEESRTVCEGFPPAEIQRAVAAIRPQEVVLVGAEREGGGYCAGTLEEALTVARAITRDGSIVLAVKTWR